MENEEQKTKNEKIWVKRYIRKEIPWECSKWVFIQWNSWVKEDDVWDVWSIQLQITLS